MGTVRNEMTIIHDWNKDRIEKLRQDAIQTFSKDIEYEDMISPIMTSFINEEYTFVINGDCSKVGWDISEKWHSIRIKWCEKHKYDAQNIVVINFGEDDMPCYIVFDNKRLQTESEGGTGTTLSEKNCKTCGQNCAIKHYGCSNWTPICEPYKAESEEV